VKRLACALAPVIAMLLLPLTALAEDQPFKTSVDSLVPKTPGLTIEGTIGGCDLLLQNQTTQNVTLFDLSKPPKPYLFRPQAKGAPPIPVHLPAAGIWPCANLPAVTEDQRWNHAEVTVGSWSVNGNVGALSFKLIARTLYDPALDPSADWTFYLRIGAGVLVVGGVLMAGPYLFKRRREILGAKGETKDAA
jgi:hypothetical protein